MGEDEGFGRECQELEFRRIRLGPASSILAQLNGQLETHLC